MNLSQRQLRVCEMVRQVISNALLKNMHSKYFPSETTITVSKVKMSKDLRIANTYVTPLGGANIEETKKILNLNKLAFQKELANNIKTKFTPKIIFFIDDTFIEAEKINNLLSQEKVKKDLS